MRSFLRQRRHIRQIPFLKRRRDDQGRWCRPATRTWFGTAATTSLPCLGLLLLWPLLSKVSERSVGGIAEVDVDVDAVVVVVIVQYRVVSIIVSIVVVVVVYVVVNGVSIIPQEWVVGVFWLIYRRSTLNADTRSRP